MRTFTILLACALWLGAAGPAHARNPWKRIGDEIVDGHKRAVGKIRGEVRGSGGAEERARERERRAEEAARERERREAEAGRERDRREAEEAREAEYDEEPVPSDRSHAQAAADEGGSTAGFAAIVAAAVTALLGALAWRTRAWRTILGRWRLALLARVRRLPPVLESPDAPTTRARPRDGSTGIDAQRTIAQPVQAPALPDSVADAFGHASRYELLEELGRGAMGVVYRARDRRLDREVALKRLSENVKSHPRALELFLREARAVAALNHANIVTVYDVDHADGEFFLTMELLAGAPLSSLLKQRGRVPPPAVVWLGRQVATGLGFAHERRIVHRDVKTANLFLTRDKAVKIMDFGLAKMMEEVRRKSTLIAGTPSYMAPEQAAGGIVDHRADLYALGATLFELLTGHPPFTEGDVLYHHHHTPPPDPRDSAPSLPDALATLVLRLLAKAPDERPESGEEVARALAAIARELPAPRA